MLNLPYTFKFYFYNQPVDMRKSFDGLYFLIMKQLMESDLSGKMFVFMNRRKDRIKVLYWDQDGFAIWYKRLEKGIFHFPCSDAKYIEISSEILSQIFWGYDLNLSKKHVRYLSR